METNDDAFDDDPAPQLEMRALYDGFDAPVTAFDCGERCTPYNPHGVPFCCDICEAVPVAYLQEWDYLQPRTDLWHVYRGDECPSDPDDPAEVWKETPAHMTLLACQGAAHCQRNYRAMSCRQFPFFPYINAMGEFIGMSYEWTFENTCWVISNLWSVTPRYRVEFMAVYDNIFSVWPLEYDSYALASENMRTLFVEKRQRIPILHRNGQDYLLSPGDERLRRADLRHWRKFGQYREGSSAA
jgi:hypothetical protein